MTASIIDFSERIGQPVPPVFREQQDFPDLYKTAQYQLAQRQNDYRLARLQHDREFLASRQPELENIQSAETDGQLQQALAPLTRYFAAKRDYLIAQFRFEYAINPPYNHPTYAQVVTFLFEKNRHTLTTLLNPELLQEVPLQYVLQSLLNDENFDAEQTIDINERDSVMSFYGQLLAVLSETDLEGTKKLKKHFYPERQNLAKINLTSNPDLLSELNIFAIRQAFHLRAETTVPEAVQIPAAGLDYRSQLDFAAYVLRTYLHPQEYRQIEADLREFMAMPGKSNWNFLQEMFGKTTQRQHLAKLPVNTGKSGEILYKALQTVYFLEYYAGFTTEKGDRDLFLEIAFLLQQRILETLPKS